MKKHLYPLLLAAVFLIGVMGHLILRPEKAEESPYTFTFCVENVNNILLYSVPNVGDTLSLYGADAAITALTHTPSLFTERREGELVTRESVLRSDLSFTLLLPACEQNGRLSVSGKPLFLGDTVTLLGTQFSLSARFVGFSPCF